MENPQKVAYIRSLTSVKLVTHDMYLINFYQRGDLKRMYSTSCNWIRTLFGYQLINPYSESKPKVTIFFVSSIQNDEGNKPFCRIQ